MKKSFSNAAQAGFTLIELIVVIVILGILAATALPKFADMSNDARTAAVQGVRGSLTSAAGLVHAQAIVRGQTGATGTVTMEGVAIATAYGYPTVASIVTAANIDGMTKFTSTDSAASGNNLPTLTTDEVGFLPSGVAMTDTKAATCYVKYTQATAATSPAAATAVVTGC
ncbi:type II secretion system protein [Massilia solisilvae]|uniref:type II secretion system protein n=1 Tax=Massilia solisilvae TaxID=1811225 RepID=UPI0027D93520|nr:type II secretion system protein [Massilia solisilvae]